MKNFNQILVEKHEELVRQKLLREAIPEAREKLKQIYPEPLVVTEFSGRIRFGKSETLRFVSLVWKVGESEFSLDVCPYLCMHHGDSEGFTTDEEPPTVIKTVGEALKQIGFSVEYYYYRDAYYVLYYTFVGSIALGKGIELLVTGEIRDRDQDC